MTPDVKGLLFGASQAEPSATGTGHVGRHTADSPFAVLLASAAPGRAARVGQPAAGAAEAAAMPSLALDVRAAARGRPDASAAGLAAAPTVNPATPAAAQAPGGATPAPAALTRFLGTASQDLEARAGGHSSSSEEAQAATESSRLPVPAPVPAPAGTGVILPTIQAAPPQAPQRRPLPAQQAPAGLATVTGDLAGAARRAPSAPAQAGAGSSAATRRNASSFNGHLTSSHPASEQAAATGDATTLASTTAQAAGHQAGPTAASAASQRSFATVRPAAPPQAAPTTVHAAAPMVATTAPTPSDPAASPDQAAAGPHAAVPAPTPTPAPTAVAAHAPQAADRTWRAASRATAPTAAAEPPPTPALEPAASQPTPQQAARREDRRPGRDEAPSPRVGATARAAGTQAEGAAPARPGAPATTPPGSHDRVIARELGTSARLAQASQPGRSLKEPADPKAARPAHAPEGAAQPLLGLQATPVAPEGSTRTAATPPRAAPLLPPDPSLAMPGTTILAHTAHLRLESETLGDLALHLRVRDGVAHVRVEGDQAAQLAGRGPELQRALAAEGLKLGRLELDRPVVTAPPQGDGTRSAVDQGQSQGQRERPEHDLPSPGAQAGASVAPRRPSGRSTAHHVEA